MILLVEDNEDDVFIMERVMRKLPLQHRLQVATDGREAINYLKAASKYENRIEYPLPSLIFLDLKLPFVHGFDVLSWIKGEVLLREIPVAVLTSSPVESDTERAYQLGAKVFLVKPPTPEMVAEALKLIASPAKIVKEMSGM
jgi:CheY-like chemotaxis protein